MGQRKLSKAQVRTLRAATETLFGEMQLPVRVHSDTRRVLLDRGLIEGRWGHLMLTSAGQEYLRENAQ